MIPYSVQPLLRKRREISWMVTSRRRCSQLRDVVNATIGFDALAADTGIPKTSLMRMLSDRGNPRAANLAVILRVIGQKVGVRISIQAEAADVLAGN